MSSERIETPIGLADLVEYRDGAVVSLALVKEKTGTVTVFAFDAGEGLSEHSAPYDALLIGLDGRATITIGGRTHVLATGQIVRLPANVPHAVHADAPFKMMLTMIRPRRDAHDERDE